MGDLSFERLLAAITQETSSSERKLEVLFTSKGDVNAYQASKVISAFGYGVDKLRAIEIMQPRLCRMSSSEARDLIGAFSIHNDKVKALGYIKRYLTDCESRDGTELVLSSFPFENDKYRALSVLNTVSSRVRDQTPAGGHQGYAALGGLYTQSPPMAINLYGSEAQQLESRPGHGAITLPTYARAPAPTCTPIYPGNYAHFANDGNYSL